MVDELAERLKSHENAFQALLSLIPSKLYYAEEAQTQWKKRKQTSDERKQAKRAKLDPDHTTSAAGGRPPVATEEAEHNEGNELTRSQIKNRMKKAKKLRELEAAKDKQMQNGEDNLTKEAPDKSDMSTMRNAPSDDYDSISPQDEPVLSPPTEPPIKSTEQYTLPNGTSISSKLGLSESLDRIGNMPAIHSPIDIPEATTPVQKSPLTNGIKSSPPSSVHSTRQSPSIPVISSPAPEVPSPSSIAELRSRLAARISQARIARKAIGTSTPGAPQTREGILQERAKRKARIEEKIRAKKETKKQQQGQQQHPSVKKEEDSSEDEIIDTGISFGRVMVNDTEIDTGRKQVKAVKRKKGPSDAKGLLKHLVSREERLAKMDQDKADKAIEHDRWHHALLSARGEKVKDDMSLLKKTVARREREKRKSKREWEERIARVEREKEERQKKREENIAKRREEKGKKGKKTIKTKKHLVKKKRPGFEGGRVKLGRK